MSPHRLVNCLGRLLVLAFSVGPLGAATYHVSTTGSDATGDGSVGNPWATIDHADSLITLLNPGDTVIVEAGTYPQVSGAGVVLQNSGGTNGAPVTYLANGNVVIDQSAFSGQTYGFQVQSPYIIVSGFEIKGAAHGIVLDGSQIWTGNNCTVTNCLIHDSTPVDSSGVYLKFCQDATVLRNVIYNINSGTDSPWSPVGAGIRMQSGDANNIWNNTIDNAYVGVFIYGTSLGNAELGHISTLNNIVANSKGWGFVNPWSTDPSWFTSGYNLVYNDVVTYGNYPANNNGPLPSDVAANPQFVFQVIHNYHLLTNSPALDAGTNVGLVFLGAAPDLGAFEGGNSPAPLGNIVGKVLAIAAGSPALAGATVQTTSGAFSTTTDANGNYFLVVPSGANGVKASGAFLSSQTLTTNVSPGGTVTLNFSLSLTNSPKTNYVDNTTGNDSNPGTLVQPWKTIGHGDAQGLLAPGDTVIVNAGTYPQASTNGVNLTNRSGYNFAPITYRAQGTVLIDQSSVSGASYGFKVAVKGIVLSGFEVKGAQHGIYLAPGSDFCTVDACVIHDANGTVGDASGIYVNQSANPALTRNLIYNINASGNTTWSPSGAGIRLQGGSQINVFNNTIDNAYLGVMCYGSSGLGSGPAGTITTENNIVVNASGWGFVNPWSTDATRFTSAYNLIFNDVVTFGNYPAGNNGPVGSDIAADPSFVNAVAHNYQLSGTSPARNMGLNVGLPFIGIAPDLGALESSYNPALATYYVATTGNDANPGTLAQPWKTIDNGDATAVLNPGDIVIVNAGTYPQASSAGANLTARHGVPGAQITYTANGNVLIDQSAAALPSYGFQLGAGIRLEGFQINGAQYGVYVMPGSDSCTVDSCVIHDGNGTAGDTSGILVSKNANVNLNRNVIYNIQATGNTPWTPVGTAIEAQYAINLNVFNNTMNNCYLGVFFYGGGGKGAGPYGHITTKNNIVANCTGWGFVNPWSVDGSLFTSGYNLVFNDVTAYGNFPAGNNAPFPSDVTTDPLFVNAAGGDFHLQAGSPAINKGTVVGLPYAGSAPDMGAYDMIDTAPPTVVYARRDSVQQTVVIVVFANLLTPATATNPVNYVLNNGNSVTAASLNGDGKTVVLTSSRLANNTTNNFLTVNNVENVDGVVIAANTKVAIDVPNDAVRLQDSSADHLLVLEAEHYNLNTPGGGQSWTFTTNPPFLLPTSTNPNFSGSGCMVVLPNAGNSYSFNPGDLPVGIPQLDFRVYFTTAGTNYIWVRGSGDSDAGGANDSISLGLDGVLAYRINGVFPQAAGYAWGSAPTPADAVFTNATPGSHVINAWMREDGFGFDKLVLSSNPAFNPSGVGPTESPVVPTLAIAYQGGNVVLSWAGGGTLQSSTNIVGTYNDIVGSNSPWTNTPTSGQKYYRVRQ